MKNKKTPKFRILRIYLSSTILYLFLVLPFFGFLALQNLPDKLKNLGDSDISINFNKDAIIVGSSEMQNDSIEKDSAKVLLTDQSVIEEDSLLTNVDEVFEDQTESNVNLSRFFKLFYKSLIACYLLGILFNWPFKIFLTRKRKKKPIGRRLNLYCKRFVLYAPLINSIILLIPHIVTHIFGISLLFSADFNGNEVDYKMFQNFFYVSAVSAFLTVLFVYFWQKNRVHLKYIEFFFTGEELRKRIFTFKRGNISGQFSLASAITTFFPLAIVVLYFVLSITTISELNLGEISDGQKKVLLGNWYESIDVFFENDQASNLDGLFYVSTLDTLFMIIGIGTGIMVSVFYIFLIVRWTTRSVVSPVNELLDNMKKIRKDGVTDFSIVRTNDEIGELAEGFNIMIQKIKNYVNGISKLNLELEGKVLKRTEEIETQKEEIETQKEEIEFQLQKTIEQKDTIEGQQSQILDSIHYAKRIQNAILPPDDVLKNKLKDFFVLYQPRDIVSGDFYWTIEKDGKIYIAVADCTGHGVPGAFLSILGISYLNEIINKSEEKSAGEILNQLRDAIIFSLHQKGSEGETQDGMEIALCIIEKDKKSLQFAGANRPLYLIRKVGDEKQDYEAIPKNVSVLKHHNNEMLKYSADTMPIGIYNESDAPFTNINIPLTADDSIYLFTDGYVDQFGGPKRKTYRVKYFRELLFLVQDKSMSEQKHILEQKINEWSRNFEQTDDILVFGMSI